jgi:predicted nucleotidyltransferase
MNPTRQYHDNENPVESGQPGTAIMKTLSAIKKTIRDHKAILRDTYNIRRIGLFGSYVRGDTHSGSDVDVIVEFTEPISLIRLVSLENYLTGIVGVKVDVVPREDIRKELQETILKEAVYV